MSRWAVFCFLVLAVPFVLGDGGNDGACSKSLEAKTQELAEVQGRLSKAEGEISDLKKAVEAKDNNLEQMNAHAAGLRGEREALHKQVDGLQNEVKKAKTECSAGKDETDSSLTKCNSELKIATGAQKQLEDELQKSMARVQLLTSDAAQLKTKVQELENSVAQSTKAQGDVEALQAKVVELERKLTESWAGWVEQGITQTVGMASPYVASAWGVAAPYVDTVSSHPAVQSAAEKGKEYANIAGAKMYEAYVAAQPAMESAMAKMGEAYKAAEPTINSAMATSQEYISVGYAVGKVKATEGYTFVRTKAIEAMESELVADLKVKGLQTVKELKGFVETQMKSIPALEPYAKSEYIDVFVYILLSLPVLVVFSMLSTCCLVGSKRRSPQTAPPQPQQGGGRTNGGKSGRRKQR